MNHLSRKSITNVFFLSILFLTLVFLFLNTIQVPLLAETAMCGEGSCTCTCIGGYCTCSAGPLEECMCWCSFPPDFDICNGKGGPEPPG